MHQEGNNMRNNNVYSNAQAYGGTQNGEGTTGRALRELLLSPLFLTAAIAFSVQILLGIIASAVGPSSFAAAFNTALEETDLYYSDPSAYYAFKDAISVINVVLAVLSAAPAIMIAVGLWIEFVSAKNRLQKMTTTGFTMIRIIVVIQLVLTGIFIAVGITGSVVVAIAMSADTDFWIALMFLFIFLIAGVAFLRIIYLLKVIKMIGSAKDTILLGEKTESASLYVTVMTFISAGLSIITSLGSLLSLNIVGFLSSTAAATAAVAFALLIQKFNVIEGYQGNSIAYNGGAEAMNDYAFHGSGPAPSASPSSAPSYSPLPSYMKPMQETVVLKDEGQDMKDWFADEGTMVLGDDPSMPPAKLIRIKDQKEVRITKPTFTIGKAYGSVDYCVEDNPAISRNHAKIILNSDRFYVMDMNSTNHVYIDGILIQPETPIQIQEGTKIRFADEVFLFKEEE